MTLQNARSGLTRRQLLARSVAAGAALVVGPGFIAGHDAAWALETTALKPETMATLVQMARDIYPHDHVPTEFYVVAVKGYDTPEAAPGTEAGIAALDAAAQGKGFSGYVGAGWERDRVDLLRAMADSSPTSHETPSHLTDYHGQAIGQAGKTPHQMNAQKQEMTMANERERIQRNSERGGEHTQTREDCIAGLALWLEEKYSSSQIKGDVFCREAMNFSLAAQQNPRTEENPNGQKEENDLLEPYRNIAGRTGRGNNDAGAMGVLNEINRKSQGNTSREPIIISGPRGQFLIAPLGSIDAAYVDTALKMLKGQQVDTPPATAERLNRAFAACAYLNNPQISHGVCHDVGKISAKQALERGSVAVAP